MLVRIFLGVGVVWLIYLLKGSLWSRLYPVAVTGSVLLVFAASLRGVPLVERLARKMGENLDERGVLYCRRVTVAWVIFLSLHLAVTISTLFMSLSLWAWYNGCIAYMLMGGMFIGEFLIRRRVKDGRRR